MSEIEVSLRIDIEGRDGEKHIAVTALKAERFTHYGFGTFLEHIDPKEVSISQEALDILLDCPERDGLQGMEFWPDNRLAWGDPAPCLLVQFHQINVLSKAKDWIREMRIEKTLGEDGG